MFARPHAQADPHRPAIVMAGSGEVVTYGEYEAAANQVAHTLVNSYLSAEEVTYIVGDCGARVLFSTVARADVADAIPDAEAGAVAGPELEAS